MFWVFGKCPVENPVAGHGIMVGIEWHNKDLQFAQNSMDSSSMSNLTLSVIPQCGILMTTSL